MTADQITLAEQTIDAMEFAVRESLREDWGHGWTFIGVTRLAHWDSDETRWRAIAEKGRDALYGYGPDATEALRALGAIVRGAA